MPAATRCARSGPPSCQRLCHWPRRHSRSLWLLLRRSPYGGGLSSQSCPRDGHRTPPIDVGDTRMGGERAGVVPRARLPLAAWRQWRGCRHACGCRRGQVSCARATRRDVCNWVGGSNRGRGVDARPGGWREGVVMVAADDAGRTVGWFYARVGRRRVAALRASLPFLPSIFGSSALCLVRRAVRWKGAACHSREHIHRRARCMCPTSVW